MSYSCMPSMARLVQADNSKKRKDVVCNVGGAGCNCTDKPGCPVNGTCKSQNVVYQARVTSEGKEESYIGLTSTEFKTRFRNHKSSFNVPERRNSTELSKHIWDLKDNGKDFHIQWKIVCQANPYNNVTKKCNLCLAEKYYIICHTGMASLNKRTELVAKCRHERAYLLGNISDIT